MRARATLPPRLGAMALLVMSTTWPGCLCARKHDAHEVESSNGMMKLTSGDPKLRCPQALVDARRGGSDAQRYVVPSETDRSTMRDAVERLVRGGWSARADVTAALVGLGWEVIDVAELGDALLIREDDAHRRGGGAYVIRPASTSRLLIEAPHTFFDEGTLPLGCELFQRAAAHAFFIDTAHRFKSAQPLPSGESPADVAHAEGSMYQAATAGFVAARAGARVVQLHGFAPRESGSRMVLSSGARAPSVLVDRAAERLRTVVGGGVMRFPADVADLGATQNVQGTLVRGAGGEFLHVEIEAGLRRDLLSNPQLRADVLGALAVVLEDA